VRWRHQLLIASLVVILALSGCGDFFVSENSIDFVTVAPTGALASAGDTVNFTATATLVSGSTNDVTSSATWNSSSPSVATVTSAGVATAVAAGTTTISAKKDSETGDATLTVTASKLQSIAITPPNPSVFSTQGTQQFVATGTFADGTTLDITNLVQWSSSSSSVATINKSGLATLVGSGTSTITATITSSGSTISATTSLTVT
jgi:hypothetical protein